MEFIKWGSETPEQREHRRKLEEQAMLNQAMAKKMFEQRAAAAAPAASPAPFGAITGPKVMGVPEFYLNNLDYVS
jgi:hypothetical protein